MKNPLQFIALIGMFIAIHGCFTGESDPQSDYSFTRGTEGIVTKIAPGSLPGKLYEGQFLGLELIVENKGAYDSPAGHLTVSGYDSDSISFSSQNVELPRGLLGKSEYNPEGDIDYVSFDESDKLKVPYGYSYTPTLTVSTCYDYQTVATPTICILPSLEDTRRDRVCTPGTVTLSSQAAPVAVTKVQQEPMLDMTNFIITIKNVGGGTVFRQGQSMENCPFSLTNDDIDIVKVDLFINGLGEEECMPESKEVKLVDGQGVIVCNFVLRDKFTYTTPLEIKLDYNYYSTIRQKVEIVALSGNKPAGSGGKTVVN